MDEDEVAREYGSSFLEGSVLYGLRRGKDSTFQLHAMQIRQLFDPAAPKPYI